MAGFENALGATILYREVLADALERWQSVAAKGRSIKPARAKCPACITEDALVDNFVDTVFGHIADEKLLEGYRASEGLCIAHFRDAPRRRRPQRRAPS